jgi:hypothetical protein
MVLALQFQPLHLSVLAYLLLLPGRLLWHCKWRLREVLVMVWVYYMTNYLCHDIWSIVRADAHSAVDGRRCSLYKYRDRK